ncbi:MAG: serine hydrolase, partial [Caldilineaceae bacterium]|nr:serine hydrolase [Caldilineaceae bacterium]
MLNPVPALLFAVLMTAACSRPQPLAGGVVVPTSTPPPAATTGDAGVTPVMASPSTGIDPATPAPPEPGVLSATGLAMQNYLTSLTDNGQFMGTVLVAQNSELVLVGGFGLADVEIPLPASPEQRYRIGSLTKQFTAAAILRLQEQGLVDVSSPLSAYLPDYPNADRITVHQLLTHTSGIPDYERLPVYMATIDQPVTTRDRFAELPLQFRPGERFAYSSSNYMVLTRIIEVVSGKSYGDFLHDEFFAPLYMTQTGLDTGDADAPDRARGYITAGEQLGPARAIDMSIPSGAGALVSNVYDLYGWMQALQTGVAL